MQNKITRSSLAACLFFFLCIGSIAGCREKQNAYTFIKPNIAVAYDSDYYSLQKRYAAIDGNEACDFVYKFDRSKKINIHVQAGMPVNNTLSKEQQYAQVMARIEAIKKIRSDTFTVINNDKNARILNGFSCIGFVSFNKISQQYTTRIECRHTSVNDQTEVTASNDNSDLENAYTLLGYFLNGFKSYSPEEMKQQKQQGGRE